MAFEMIPVFLLIYYVKIINNSKHYNNKNKIYFYTMFNKTMANGITEKKWKEIRLLIYFSAVFYFCC